MPKLDLTPTELRVTLSRGEKLAALHGDITVPLSKISGAEVLPQNFFWKLGLRLPGTGLPYVIVAGTYIAMKDRAFVSWMAGKSVLQVNLVGQNYTRLVLGVDDAETWAENINAYLAGC